jgi:hypothetical protein
MEARLRKILSLGFAVLLTLAGRAQAQKLRNHFDSDALMREPAFFDFLVLGAPGEAQWKVMAEFNPPSTPHGVSQVLAERPSESIAVAIRRNVTLQNGTISIGIKHMSGRGGMVFRLASEKNYLALLLDPVSGDARLIASRGGRTSELARGKAEGTRDWGILTVVLSGSKVAASWEGRALFEASDSAPASGRTGIATAGPGIMSFDEFTIEPADKPAEKKP